MRCHKPTYPELERAIARLDVEMGNEGPIEDLYRIYQHKFIENVKFGLGFVLGSDQESVILAERWLRSMPNEDIDTKIMLSFMLAGYLGANLVELHQAVWTPVPENPKKHGLLKLTNGEYFDVFGFALEWMKKQDWNLAEQYAEVRASLLRPPEIPPAGSVREKNIQRVATFGLTVSPGLPQNLQRVARPTRDVAARIVALKLLIGYVAIPPESLQTTTIQSQIQRLCLGTHFAPAERAILRTPRTQAHQTYLDSIGWSIESLSVLCWCLGLPAPMDGGIEPLSDQDSLTVVMRVAPSVSGDLDPWFNAAALRDLSQVEEMEDLYYCLHNAARNAVLKSDSIPSFEPGRHGMVIQTRRQAFTWVLSPGIAWADTDAST